MACSLDGAKPYLNQCWNIVNWTLRNKLQWNFNRNSYIFIQENVLQKVVCEMASILSRPQCVKMHESWETFSWTSGIWGFVWKKSNLSIKEMLEITTPVFSKYAIWSQYKKVNNGDNEGIMRIFEISSAAVIMPSFNSVSFFNYSLSLEVVAWISNWISNFTGHVMIHPCWDQSPFTLIKGVPNLDRINQNH